MVSPPNNTPPVPHAAVPHADRFEAALREPDPIAPLRAFALELAAQGLRQGAVYDVFLTFYKYVQNTERWRDEALLGDVMDMIGDTYAPYLHIPK